MLSAPIIRNSPRRSANSRQTSGPTAQRPSKPALRTVSVIRYYIRRSAPVVVSPSSFRKGSEIMRALFLLPALAFAFPATAQQAGVPAPEAAQAAPSPSPATNVDDIPVNQLIVYGDDACP